MKEQESKGSKSGVDSDHSFSGHGRTMTSAARADLSCELPPNKGKHFICSRWARLSSIPSRQSAHRASRGQGCSVMDLGQGNDSAGLETSDKQGGMREASEARETLEASTQIDGSWLWNADPSGRSTVGPPSLLLKAGDPLVSRVYFYARKKT